MSKGWARAVHERSQLSLCSYLCLIHSPGKEFEPQSSWLYLFVPTQPSHPAQVITQPGGPAPTPSLTLILEDLPIPFSESRSAQEQINLLSQFTLAMWNMKLKGPFIFWQVVHCQWGNHTHCSMMRYYRSQQYLPAILTGKKGVFFLFLVLIIIFIILFLILLFTEV